MAKNDSSDKTPPKDQTERLERSFRVLTDRFRESRRALRESNLYLETILATARAGMWIWDLKEEWETTPGLNLLFGRSEDDPPIKFHEFSSLIHPDDLQRVSDAWHRTVQANDPYEQEYRIIWPDGSIHWLTSRGNLLKTSSDVTQFVGISFDITERKKSDEALRESETKFKDLVEKSNAGVYLIQDGVHKYVNTKLAEIHGYDPDEMIDRIGPEDTVHPDDWAASLESMRLRDAGLRSQYRQFRIVRKDGEVRDVEVYGSRTTYRGRPATIGTMLDITERKQTQEALQREKDRLAAVLNSIQDDIRFIDMKNRIILANPAALTSLGRENVDHGTYPDLMSRVDVRTLDGEKITFENAPSQRALKGIVVKHEEQIVRIQSTGEQKYKEVSASPVKDQSGNIVGAVLVVRDITARKQAEAALKASEEQFRRAIEDAPIPTIMQAEDGEVLQLSRTWTELTGYTTEDIRTVDEWTTKTVYGEGTDKVRYHLRELFSGMIGPVNLEFTIRTARGEDRYWSFSASSPGTLRDGRRFIVGMVDDITERKNMEEALRRSRDELEIRVEERTEELSHAYAELQAEMRKHQEVAEKLRQSQKMEAIGTLAGGIAHDFNNILAGILGFAEMAIEDAEGQPQIEKSLAKVIKSAKRGRDLVTQILAFSRKTGHDRTPLSVTPILKETIKLLRASIPATVDIKFSFTAQSDTIMASPTELQQIVMNLATNASMAMQEKGGILEITLSDAFHPHSTDVETPSGEFLQLIVSDTGIGMTPEVLQKAFDPFFTTREPGKGTGMGLSVVYGIVTNLNGTITVSSTHGEGSTFRILLPKAKVQQETVEEKSTSELQGGKETILFVEDEELINEWGRTNLEKLGYTVMAYSDPEEALQTFSLFPQNFDLVITDQSMPKMAGTQLASKILSLRQDIPIILCTGHAELITPEKTREIGITQVILKPLTKNEFASAIRRVLDRDTCLNGGEK